MPMPHVNILSVHIQLSEPQAKFGEVKEGRIRLNGRLMKAEMTGTLKGHMIKVKWDQVIWSGRVVERSLPSPIYIELQLDTLEEDFSDTNPASEKIREVYLLPICSSLCMGDARDLPVPVGLILREMPMTSERTRCFTRIGLFYCAEIKDYYLFREGIRQFEECEFEELEII
jgi:hypothetical protein